MRIMVKRKHPPYSPGDRPILSDEDALALIATGDAFDMDAPREPVMGTADFRPDVQHARERR